MRKKIVEFSLSNQLMQDVIYFSEKMDQALPKIEDGVLTVRIVGEFSAGKTRVIRELLDDKIPEKFKPISSQEAQTKLQLEISYAENQQLLLIEKPDDRDIEVNILASLDEFPSREAVSEYDPSTHRLRLLINEPKFILANGDGYSEGNQPKKLFLIDTPGWNSGEDDFAEQDAQHYFVGEHNLAIVYVCHANRLDGVINQCRLSNFLEVLGDAIFLQGKAHLRLVITHCEHSSQVRLKEKMQQRITEEWQNLGFESEDLDLNITPLDFEEMNAAQLNQFRNDFWEDLLAPLGNQTFDFKKSYSQQILQWQDEWDIRPMLFQHLEVIQRIKTYIARLYIDEQFIHNMNMTRLVGLERYAIQGTLLSRWYSQLDTLNFESLLDDIKLLNLQLPQQHPLAQWWSNYWIAKIQPICDLFETYVRKMLDTINQVDVNVNDLQDFLSKKMLQSYQSLTAEQETSFDIFIQLIEDKMRTLELDNFVATLLKVSVLQTRYQDHYHHCEGK